MKKMMLVDGNSLLFRAFYATIYGRPMTTSEGIYTNAVFAFANMMNKAIDLIQPDAILIAFDSSKKNFRHELYSEYKGGRKETPIELIGQFQIIREFCDAMNYCRYEKEGIEADDIIGSMVNKYSNYDINILSSDRDLLQLINENASVWLLKKGLTDIDEVTNDNIIEKIGVNPKQIIDLKGLSGDKSDNIPGIPKVGDKTALKLLNEYHSLENIIENSINIKGKLGESITTYKEQALLSKRLATIKTDEEIPLNDYDFTYEPKVNEQMAFYQKYEMNSLIRKLQENSVKEVKESTTQIQHVLKCPSELLHEDVLILFDMDLENPYLASLYGLALKDEKNSVYMVLDDVMKDECLLSFLSSNLSKMSYDVKNVMHVLNRYDLVVNHLSFDAMIAIFLCDTTINSLEKIQIKYDFNLPYQLHEIYGKENKMTLPLLSQQIEHIGAKADLLYQAAIKSKEDLKTLELESLFYDIEMPLATVLFNMEKQGIHVDQNCLDDISKTMKDKIDEISSRMNEYTDEEVNYNSPKQLAVLLFDKLGLKENKKRSTSIEILEKLKGKHPIIDDLISYRKYQKLVSTYSEGLKKSIFSDGKIHTIYNQCITQTGRLSSTAPNLQNISVRDEEGRLVRKAFVATGDNVLLSADYSQVELRILAHMAKEKRLIETFNLGIDVHTQTACDIFEVQQDEVTSLQRRQAKAVNFGIVYGISDFGLSEQLQISVKEAQAFIEKYLQTYPNISIFMKEVVDFCIENGYVKTILNRRREIKEIHDKNYMIREFGKRAAMNAPIQGTAADLIKIAMINIEKELKARKLKSKMILQVHDELIFDVVIEEIEVMKELVKSQMKHAMKLDVELEVQVECGKTWYEAK